MGWRDRLSGGTGGSGGLGTYEGPKEQTFEQGTGPRRRPAAGGRGKDERLDIKIGIGDPADSGGGLLGTIGQIPLPPGIISAPLRAVGILQEGQDLPFSNVGDIVEDAVGPVVNAGLTALDYAGNEVEKHVAGVRLRSRGADTGVPWQPAIDPNAGWLENLRKTDPQRAADVEAKIAARKAIPEEFLLRMDQGEDINVLAAEMADLDVGFSSDFETQLVSQLLYDPLNLILPGVGKLAGIGKAAGAAVRGTETGADLGLGTRFTGTIWNGLSKGMSASQARIAGKVFGPTTNGIVRGFGVSAHRTLFRAADQFGPEVRASVESYVARGHAYTQQALHWERSTIHLSEEGGIASKLTGEQVGRAAEAAATTRRANDASQFAKDGQVFARATREDFAGKTMDEIIDETQTVAADLFGVTKEEAAAALGKIDRDVAATIRQAAWGKAMDITESSKVLARANPAGISIESVNRVTAARLDSFTRGTLNAAIKSLAPPKVPKGAAATLKATTASTTITPGQVAASQAANVAVGVARGGTAASGGAVLGKSAQQIADDLVKLYKPLREKFGGVSYTPADVLKELRRIKASGGLPEVLSARKRLPPALISAREDLRKLGYDLVLEPKDGMRNFINPLKQGPDKLDKMPWIPLISEATPAVELRNRMGQFVDWAMKGLDQRLYVQNAVERAVKSSYGAWSAKEARDFIGAVMARAIVEETTPRGLLMSTKKIDEIAQSVMSKTRYAEMMKSTTDPVWLLVHAFEGDFSVVGWAQKFTGMAKTAAVGTGEARMGAEGVLQSYSPGHWVPAIAENIFPNLRWKFAPHFQWMERTESTFWAITHGSQGTNITSLTDAQVQMWRNLIRHSDFVRQTLEAQNVVALQSGRVAQGLVGPRGVFARLIHAVMGGDVRGFKVNKMIETAASDHPELFRRWAENVSPEYVDILKQWYKTDDWSEITRAFLKERMDFMQSGGKSMNTLFDNAAKQFKGDADLETLWQGWRGAAEESMRNAHTLHFFRADRSWLERSINHVFFGLYPFSYMFGKVLPEYLRFLMKRPFGLNVPLGGLLAQQKFYATLQGAMATDPEFLDFIQEHKETLYVLDQMLPSSPFFVSAGVSRPVGNIIQGFARGKPVEAITQLPQDMQEAAFQTRNPFTGGEWAVGIGQELVRDVNDWLGAAEKMDTRTQLFPAPALPKQ